MTTTVLDRATTAVLAALQAAPPVASSVDRVRMTKMTGAEGAAGVHVLPMGASPYLTDMLDDRPAMWLVTVQVDCTVLVPFDTPADQAVYPLLSAVYARLMDDLTLGGQVDHLEVKKIDLDYDIAADGFCRATLDLAVTVPSTTLTTL